MNNIFESIKPLKNNKSFYNQNGTYTAVGYIKGQKVKIYAPPDKNTIKLRLFLEKTKCKKYFPNVVFYDANYIAEEWIDAPTLSECNKQFDCNNLIMKFIFDLQSIEYDEIVFDYIEYIFKRINKTDHKLLSKIKELKIPAKINHNDLHPDNIILVSEQIKLIDNEFLGNSHGWIMNLKNSFLNNDETYYKKYIDKKTLEELWEIRTAFIKKY